MLREMIVGSAFAVAAVATQQGQQTGYPRPTLDTGPVRVEGSVSVTNDVDVRAAQAGTWSVNVGTLPPIETASPDFIVAGRVYRLTSAGVELVVRISEVRRGGWVRGRPLSGGNTAWYNLSQFQTVVDDNDSRR